MRGFVEEVGFGALFAATPDGPRVAHVPPVFLDDRRIGFHIARANGIARHLDGRDAWLNSLFHFTLKEVDENNRIRHG